MGRLKYSDSWWVVLDIPGSIGRYYTWWSRKLSWKRGSPPLFHYHCTVVNGKYSEPPNKQFWKKYDGARVAFEYSSTIYTDEKESYYWIKIRCEFLSQIRRELGLSPFARWDWHASVLYVDR